MPVAIRLGIRDSFRKPMDMWSYGDKEKKKDHSRVKNKLAVLCYQYDVLANPQFIPVVVIKMKRYIREHCPLYLERLL